VALRRLLAAISIGFCLYLPSLHAYQDNMVEMKVKRVMLDPSSKTPTAVVILENVKEKKVIPIWIGSEEATSIAMELEHVSAPRPNAHDLIRNIVQGLGAALHRITITDLRNNVYYASITLKLKGQEFQVDSRPSDAIAVALRMKAPIFASTQVLAKAKQLPSSETGRIDFRKILGIHAQDLTSELASLLDLQARRGVLVADVELRSLASEAGIQRGDIIVKLNERAVQRASDLEAYLEGIKRPGQAKIEVLRKGKTSTVIMNLP